MAKLKAFDITARLVLIVSTTIKAESMEDAIEQSKEMCEKDFVTIPEFLDGSIVITGVSKSGVWKTEQE